MSKPINFTQYRLAHVPYRRERWLRPPLGTLNTLHNRRLEFDKHFINQERAQTKRTYYKRVEPNSDFGKICAHLNTMIDRLRETGQPAIVLDFSCGKQTLAQQENGCAENSMTSSEVN